MGNQDKIEELLGRYLAGDVSEEEKSEVVSWLDKSEKNRNEFELHRKIWQHSKITFSAPDADIVFKNVLSKIDDDHEKEIDSSFKTVGKQRTRTFNWVSKIAAAIVVFVTLGYFVVQSLEQDVSDLELKAKIVKQNPAGQKSKIFLPDGSEVWLNAESSISYPEKFSDSTRKVLLEGEAFFSVIKNPDKPFIVTAGDIVTTVLETSFYINAYGDKQHAYIALQTGKVTVEISNDHNSQELYLEPREGISYDKSSRIALKEEFDEELEGWNNQI